MLQAEEQHAADVKARSFPGVLWLRLRISTAREVNLIPDQVTKILHAVRHGQKKKKKKKKSGDQKELDWLQKLEDVPWGGLREVDQRSWKGK